MLLSVTGMLVDLSVTIMQVTVADMQLEVSTTHMQVTVSSANVWMTVSIMQMGLSLLQLCWWYFLQCIMHITVSIAIMQVTFLYSYVGQSLK